MPYTLATAAKATGLNRSTILKAIKTDKIVACKDLFGQWCIEPSELHRVYPAIAELSAGSDTLGRRKASKAAALDAQIEALIKKAEGRLQQQLAEVHRRHDAVKESQPAVIRKPW
jgi:hypothetical protein